MKYFFYLLIMLCTVSVFSQQKVNDRKYNFMPSSFSFNKKANGYVSTAMPNPKFKKTSLISLSGSIVSNNPGPEVYLMLTGKHDTIIRLKLDEHGEAPADTRYIYMHYLPANFKTARIMVAKHVKGTIQKISVRMAEIPDVSNIESIMQPQQNEQYIDDRAASCNCPQPSYTSRSGWGCTQANWSPTIAAPTHLVIHHEAPGSSNPNQSSNWAQRVLGTWDYHVNTRGWSDIGYNWLIDPNGVVYEGRYRSSIADSEGAHWSCNAKSTAVCMLGDYTSVNITSSAQNSLVNLYAWKACQHNIDPFLQSYNTAQGATLNNVCGHRNGPCASTSCPGNTLYNNLSTIRTLINDKMTSCSANQSPTGLNDDCNDAVNLTSQTSCNYTAGSVTNAAQDFFTKPSCDNYSPASQIYGAGVFYKFTAVSTTHTITVAPTGTLDAVLVLYSGGCFSLQEVSNGCMDTPGGNGVVTTLTVNNLTIGQQYTIRVYDYGSANTTSGGFNICVTHQQVPCTYQFSSSSQTTSAYADSYSLGIASPSSCSWNVQESCSWVSLSNTSGTGNGQITVNVTANTTGQSRTCTITMNNATHTITQPAQPCQISVTASANPSTISAGGSSSLSTSGNWSQCQWSPSNSLSNANSCSPTASPSSNTTYTVTVTDGNNCTASSSVTVTVAPCQISVTASANPSTINAGGTSSLSTNGNWSQCQWSPTGSLINANTCSPTATPSSTTNYTVTVTDANNCTASASVVVNVGPIPCNTSTASLGSNNEQYTASSTNASINVGFTPAAIGCTWSVSQNNCSWISNLMPNTPQLNGGNITYTVAANTDAQARTCTLKITAGSNTYDLVITQQGTNNTPCSPPVNVSGFSINTCELSIEPMANVLYQWYLNNAPLSNSNSNMYNACNPGTYQVEVTSLLNTSCKDTSEALSFNCQCVVGIEDIFASSFNIYPNPSNGSFSIQFTTERVEEVTMVMYNTVGQLVKNEELSSAGNKHEHNINVTNLAKGIYILQLKAGTQILNKRIEIQ